MKVIVTHVSPDLDAITSVWLIRKFLPGWENAQIDFVLAGEKLKGEYQKEGLPIEIVGTDEVIHVDTGFGVFDHHQTLDSNISAATLVFDYVSKKEILARNDTKKEAVRRIVEVVLEDDHFQEVYYPDPLAFYHDFSFVGLIEGTKFEQPGQDLKNTEFIIQCLDAFLHAFENRIWAEKEINEKGIVFTSKWGKGLAVETMNDTVLDLAQKMGYEIVVRKDPNTGFARIKGKPAPRAMDLKSVKEVDLTSVYEQLKKMDPEATWFLHVSRKMLLNGSTKNPKMKGTTLSLADIIEVLKSI